MAARVPTKISAKHFHILVLSSSTCRSMVLWKVPTFLLLWTQRVTFTSRAFEDIEVFFLLGVVPFLKDVYRLKQLNVGGGVTLKESYETLVPTSFYQACDIDHLVIPTQDIAHPVIPTRDYLENATRSRTTYMHCKAGKERSTTIMLCYLVEYRHMTPIAALEYV
ncbi:putative phosphoric monoester hydrolase [Helianthus debilis subsp. tardiflorus]